MAKNHFQFPINLCVTTAHFFAEACKKGLKSWRSQHLWKVLKEILSQPQNLLAQKKFLLPVEKAEIAPEVLRNGFSVIPVQNEELHLVMEILNLPTPHEGKKSVLISRGKNDFPELLDCLKKAGVSVNVIAIDEPMPAGFESLVENWINVSASQEEPEKTDTPAGEQANLEESVGTAMSVMPEEKETEAPIEVPEMEEDKEAEIEADTAEEKLTTDEVLAKLTLGNTSITNEIPKAKCHKVPFLVTLPQRYDGHVQQKAQRIVDKLTYAIDQCGLQKSHLENPKSAESPVKLPTISEQTDFKTLESMRLVFNHLRLAYDWFRYALPEYFSIPKLGKSIVQCANNALELLGMYYTLIGNRGDGIYCNCLVFINEEIKTDHNKNRLNFESRKHSPCSDKELERIEKELMNLKGIYEDLLHEREVKKHLEAKIQKLSHNPENSSEIFGSIMDDIHDLFTYFGCKPSDDYICDLFRPALKYFPEGSDFSEYFYQIRSEIEYKVTSEEMNKYTHSELENKYRFNSYVQTVREHFKDQILVVIGGIPKPKQKKNFEDAFGCEVEWEETSHCDSLDRYQPYLHNPKVCAFMVMVQLSSHKHSQELCDLARKEDKRFFRIHTTNPIAAAKEIVEQYI